VAKLLDFHGSLFFLSLTAFSAFNLRLISHFVSVTALDDLATDHRGSNLCRGRSSANTS